MKDKLILLILLLMPIQTFAQTQENDSLADGGLSQKDIEELRRPVDNFQSLPNDDNRWSADPQWLKTERNRNELLTPPSSNTLPPSLVIKKEDILGKYPLPAWETGYVYGSSYTQANILYGAMSVANAGIRQHFGRNLVVQGEIGLQKHSIYYNTATANGQMVWQPSPYFAITAFGSYSPGSFMSTVDIGQSFQWGGYVTLQTDTSVPFGIDLGARQTYDAMFGHEVVPIVQPFIKVGGSKIGIDIGPMLKEATRKHQGGNDNGFNPIPQPIKALPPVAPRR